MTEPKQINIYEISKIEKSKIRSTIKEKERKFEDKVTFYVLAHNTKNAIEKGEMLTGVDEILLDAKLFSDECFL